MHELKRTARSDSLVSESDDPASSYSFEIPEGLGHRAVFDALTKAGHDRGRNSATIPSFLRYQKTTPLLPLSRADTCS